MQSEYIAALAEELSKLARDAQHEFLAYLLDVAAAEARARFDALKGPCALCQVEVAHAS